MAAKSDDVEVKPRHEGRNGVPNIPISSVTLENNDLREVMSPTFTSDKAARPPVVGPQDVRITQQKISRNDSQIARYGMLSPVLSM